MLKKRGQTWSIETYLAIGIFLIAIIFFYSLTTMNTVKSNVEVEVEEIGRSLMGSIELRDGILTQDELNHFINMSCSDLQHEFDTNKYMCIYIKDQDGFLINNGTNAIYGFGCPDINISGIQCGQN